MCDIPGDGPHHRSADPDDDSAPVFTGEPAAVPAGVDKAAAFAALRAMVAADSGPGVTTESIVADLDVLRGPWPGEENTD